MSLSNPASRRRFLLQMGSLAGLGTAASALSVLNLGRIAAAEASLGDYKALVCIFLFGGNDSWNCVVPSDAAGHGAYALARRDLTVPRDALLPLTDPRHADPLGRTFGLNPAMGALHPLFEIERKLAVTLNVGTLVAPLDKRQLRAGTVPRPPSLESHADQTFQTQTAGIFTQENGFSGWAGRATDQLEAENARGSLFAGISLSGQNVLQSGQGSMPFVVDGSGSFEVNLSKYVSGNMGDRLRNGVRGLLSTSPHVFASTYGATKDRALDGNLALSRALAGAAVPAGFPATGLGRQLRTVAQIMSVAPSLGIRRQTFFCGTGGFDTHADQNHAQPGLLGGLAQAMAAFYQYTVAAGLEDSVTTFTASEFARTLAMNGSFGTDHAWGGVQFVLGGAVRGGLHGTMPDQTLGGPDDMGTQGRFIPTTAVDQIASTLALWFGVSPSALGDVTPGIGNFDTADLGFMASG